MTTAIHADTLPLPALAASPSVDRIEVRILWNGLCRDVVERDAHAGATLFTVGEAPECDAHVPAECLGGVDKLALVSMEDDEVRIASLGTVNVEALRHGPVEVALGALTFQIRAVERSAAFHAPLDMDWRSHSMWGISLGLHLVFFVLIALVPPQAAGFSFDEALRTNRYTAVMIAPPEARPQLAPPEQKVNKDDGGDVAPRAKGAEGEAGARDSARTHNRYALKQHDASLPLALRREDLKEMAAKTGILGVMAAAPAMSSPFGALIENGKDPENVLAALIGDQTGPNFGYGGLGVRGTGRHGGGDCPDCLGLVGSGNDLIGNTLKKGRTGRPGYDAPDLAQKKKGPDVDLGKGIIMKGTLAKEIIARVVRRHKPEIEHCYEKGLAKNASLGGRIAIRFQIGLTGSVDRSAVAESSLGDADTEACIANVFRRMTFPTSEGMVFVTYPFNLSHAE